MLPNGVTQYFFVNTKMVKELIVRLNTLPPCMFLLQKKTEFKTLDGKYATPYKFDTIKEAKKFIEQYKQQPHLVFGLDRFAYTFLYDTYPNQVPWDNDKILTVTIDIETQCENGFPDPQLAVEEMRSITIRIRQQRRLLFGVSVIIILIEMMLHILTVQTKMNYLQSL